MFELITNVMNASAEEGEKNVQPTTHLFYLHVHAHYLLNLTSQPPRYSEIACKVQGGTYKSSSLIVKYHEIEVYRSKFKRLRQVRVGLEWLCACGCLCTLSDLQVIPFADVSRIESDRPHQIITLSVRPIAYSTVSYILTRLR